MSQTFTSTHMPASKKKAKKLKKTSPSVEFTKPLNEVPTFYANNTQVAISPYDLRLTFGQVADLTDKGVTVEPQTMVLMSLDHAKAVRDLLISQLDKYEEVTIVKS